MKIDNIYKNIKNNIDDEIIDEIFYSDSVKITRISSTNQNTEWFCEDIKEVAILLEGEAVIEFEKKEISMKKGDVIIINPLERHRVINTSPTGLWLAIYFR
ncbi:MAG: cupin domain-containing protein [Acholeplasmataceae bacterium]|jgi:cupin 2 domain-containing protein